MTQSGGSAVIHRAHVLRTGIKLAVLGALMGVTHRLADQMLERINKNQLGYLSVREIPKDFSIQHMHRSFIGLSGLFIKKFLILFLISCQSSPEISEEMTVDGASDYDEEFTPHPLPHLLPHTETNSAELELRYVSEIVEHLPGSLQLLHRFLTREITDIYGKELSVLLDNYYGTDVEALNENKLLILDRRDDRLIQYNLTTDNYESLAPRGRGPGDLMFSREMQVADNRAYIAMQGYRVSVFDCEETTCEYDYTINTDMNNYSLSFLDERLVILGIPPFGRDHDPDPENIDQYTVHVMDLNGDVDYSFNRVYQHRNPVVREAMNSYGTVRSFPEYDTQIVTHRYYPYIYAYDVSGELKQKIEFPEHQQGYYDFREGSGGDFTGRWRHNDNTSITGTNIVNHRWLLIQVRNRKNMEWSRDGLNGDQWHSYFAFDVQNKELYRLGEEDVRDLPNAKSIYITDHGLVINEQGTLYWVGQ